MHLGCSIPESIEVWRMGSAFDQIRHGSELGDAAKQVVRTITSCWEDISAILAFVNKARMVEVSLAKQPYFITLAGGGSNKGQPYDVVDRVWTFSEVDATNNTRYFCWRWFGLLCRRHVHNTILALRLHKIWLTNQGCIVLLHCHTESSWMQPMHIHHAQQR